MLPLCNEEIVVTVAVILNLCNIYFLNYNVFDCNAGIVSFYPSNCFITLYKKQSQEEQSYGYEVGERTAVA